jgi:multiple stress resistance protein BhsA
MKNLKLAIAAIALSTLSFASLAAQEVSERPANQSPIGMVSANSVSGSVTDLTSKLGAKADAADASSYRVITAGGNNLLHGTAELYK